MQAARELAAMDHAANVLRADARAREEGLETRLRDEQERRALAEAASPAALLATIQRLQQVS